MMDQTDWKSGIKKLLNLCQDEVKKTTKIGHKMIHASHTNTCLKDAYEKLGKVAFEAMESKSLVWEDEMASDLYKIINDCRNNLVILEEEVNKIKFQDKSEVE